MLKIPNFPLKPTIFLSEIIEKTYINRIQTGYKRNDIIDACIEAMNKENIHLTKTCRSIDKVRLSNESERGSKNVVDGGGGMQSFTRTKRTFSINKTRLPRR